MNRTIYIGLTIILLFGSAFLLMHSEKSNSEVSDWSINATTIEACTCPMFCQCYFNTEPAGHEHAEGESTHYCKFNMAWKINEGHYGDVNLDGVTFWIAGDLGEGWEDGEVDWAKLHFDPSVTSEQKEGITEILGPLFPAEWQSFSLEEDLSIQWEANSNDATALLNNGRAGEMRLATPATALNNEPAVLTNIQYWGAPRNDGFVMMPNTVQAYRIGDNTYESNGTNGFMITIDMNSNDI
ncbi:DUF1326 domain-containing protein [Rhodohalobacter barkolensis]|uniref:DUF1326 domain-containing protein n=1 Tax=Rhodohalobacter barkolensis TaxID=2053187 RepID=A0A2N0VIW3_9BACT|nr:DUF1326 domain-containing protein [Rhodohalobacter barkolensis]PKD44126.1 hypothetical protein CWD77_01255 [Rhodohalobacter barkolensis]